MNRAQTINLIKVLISTYPNTQIADVKTLVQSWEMMFADDDAETVYKAVRMHMAKSKWFPKPAEIRKHLDVASHMYNGSPVKMLKSGADDFDGANTGCDICPYFINGWAMSPSGCHRERCAIE